MGTAKGEWVSLSEAAGLLGVHPSTVRSWADRGELPAHRTAGGHRRFRRSDIELWSASHAGAPLQDMLTVIQNAMGRTRLEVAEGRLAEQGWYRKLSESQRRSYRASARRLLSDLLRYVAEEGREADAEALGAEYGRLGRQAGMTVAEAVEAFLFFREFLMESFFNLSTAAGTPSAPAWGEMRRRAARFTDLMLLSLIRMYP
jgi:excisionase family DNA binding protein